MRRIVIGAGLLLVACSKPKAELRAAGAECGARYERGSNAFYECLNIRGISMADCGSPNVCEETGTLPVLDSRFDALKAQMATSESRAK